LNHLRFLEISDTNITEQGLKRLAAIPSLQVISFSAKNAIDPSALKAWQKLPKLHTVIINGRPMNSQWMQKMKGQRSHGWLPRLVPDAEAAENGGSSAPIEVAQLKDRSPSGSSFTGLKRIHYVESELDNVIEAPPTINQDNQQDTEKNFLGEITINAGSSGKRRPKAPE
jgi:hypothetical protein